MIPTLLFSAPSNSGKTLYISSVIPLLKRKGLKIGFLKHHHGTFYPREKLKDTGKMIQSGALKTLLIAEDEIVIEEPNRSGREKDLSTFVERYLSDCDIVLVEGFKEDKTFPKVLLLRNRATEHMRKWYETARNDANVIALIASPANEFSDLPYPVFKTEDQEGFVEFVLTYFNLRK